MASWLFVGSLLVIWAAVITVRSARFGYDTEVVQMPIMALFSVLLVGAGLFIATLAMLQVSAPINGSANVPILTVIVIAGLASRIICCLGEPILEDDYQRYLWDGAVTGGGQNPYRYAPAEVLRGGTSHPLADLADQSGFVLQRIGHGELTTIYQPIAQSAFAAAYLAAPFSLGAWRVVLLIADLATLLLLMRLLTKMGRSQLWISVYWWNPLVIKHVFNAAHMDALLLPPLLSAVLFAEHRPRLATSAVGIAMGVKFWPVMLLPLIWRRHWDDWRRLPVLAAVFLPFALLALWPQLSAGLDRDAGVVAYSTTWSRNSALFPLLESVFAFFGGAEHASSLTRAGLVVAMVGVIGYLAWPPVASLDDLVSRTTLAIGALLLLSPAQYPWYVVWLMPFMALYPVCGFLVLTATMPLYELYFFFAARDAVDDFSRYVVWAIWLPVWTTLIIVDARGVRPRWLAPFSLRRITS
jgi:hypothetical protein